MSEVSGSLKPNKRAIKKELRQADALKRKQQYEKLTLKQRLEELDKRPGESAKQRQKLNIQIKLEELFIRGGEVLNDTTLRVQTDDPSTISALEKRYKLNSFSKENVTFVDVTCPEMVEYISRHHSTKQKRREDSHERSQQESVPPRSRRHSVRRLRH